MILGTILVTSGIAGNTRNTKATPQIPAGVTGYFNANQGQLETSVLFYARTGSGDIYLTRDGIYSRILGKDKQVVLLKAFAEGSFTGVIEGLDALSGKINFIQGQNSQQWTTNTPCYQKVAFRNFQPGVDMIFQIKQGQLETRLISNTETTLPQTITFQYQIKGADNVTVNNSGDLEIQTAAGTLTEKASSSVQWQLAENSKVTAKLTTTSPETKAQAMDTPAPTRINQVVFSTLLGSSDPYVYTDVQLDHNQNIVVAGTAVSNRFPTTPGSYDTTYNSSDFFIAKLNPSGTEIIFSTFLGGSDSEVDSRIALDSADNIYLTGKSSSSDYPVTSNALQTTWQGSWDVVLAKLNSTGSQLLYSTYIGGDYYDHASDILWKTEGKVILTGYTSSTNFLVTDTTHKITEYVRDPFLLQVNTDSSVLDYSFCLGGSGMDEATQMAMDSAGNIYLIGFSTSTDLFVTENALKKEKTWYNSIEDMEGFLYVINGENNNILYGSYLGGSKNDTAMAMAIDSEGNVFIAGNTDSSDFPVTPDAYDTTFNPYSIIEPEAPNSDVFVMKLTQSCDSIIYATYLGGPYSSDRVNNLVIDSQGNAVVIGTTNSEAFPVTTSAIQTTTASNHENIEMDVFITQFDHEGKTLEYSTYWGGNNGDIANSAVVDPQGYLIIGGITQSGDFPTTAGAYDQANAYNCNAFVTKFGFSPLLPVLDVKADKESGLAPLTVILTPQMQSNITQWTMTCNGQTFTGTTSSPVSVTFNSAGEYSVKLWAANAFGESSTYKMDFIKVFNEQTVQLPAIKQLYSEYLAGALYFPAYDPAPNGSYQITQNGIGTAEVSYFGNELILLASYETKTATNLFQLNHDGWHFDGINEVRVKPYRIGKLPPVYLRPNESIDFPIGDYTYDSMGRAIPPSYGIFCSLVEGNKDLISASWVNTTTIRITALSGFTTGQTYADVFASPQTLIYKEYDRERITVYANQFPVKNARQLVTLGVEGKTGQPQITANEEGLINLNFTSNQQGLVVMPPLNKMWSCQKNQWYIARMQVKASTIDNQVDASLFHFNGVLPGSSRVDVACNLVFSVPTAWTWIETPLYSKDSGTGYIQIIMKNNGNPVTVSIQNIQWVPADPVLMQTRAANILDYPGKNFNDFSRWGFETNGCQYRSAGTNLEVQFNGLVSEQLKMTAKNIAGGVYTPECINGRQIGMKAKVQPVGDGFNQMDSLQLLACYGVTNKGQTAINQVIAGAEFGFITPGYQYLAGNSFYPYSQFQMIVKNNQAGLLEIRDVDFLMDNDRDYHADYNLF